MTTATWLLVAVRTLAAILLLLGVGARASAIALAVAGAWLMAAAKHRAGLVPRRIAGRDHTIELAPHPLADAAGWLATFEDFWPRRGHR